MMVASVDVGRTYTARANSVLVECAPFDYLWFECVIQFGHEFECECLLHFVSVSGRKAHLRSPVIPSIWS